MTITKFSEPVLNFVWPLEFCLLPSDVESRSLPMHVLAEEILKDSIFSLNSPFRSDRGCLPVVLNLKYLNNTFHATLTYMYRIHSNQQFFERENFGQENIGDSLTIGQKFLPPKFCILRYMVGHTIDIHTYVHTQVNIMT